MVGTALSIEPGYDRRSGRCECCGHVSRHLQGFLYLNNDAHGVYLVSWSEGHPELGASMLVSVHGWGEGADPSQKVAAVVTWHREPTGIVVSDAAESQWAGQAGLGRLLNRDEVVGQPLAEEIYAASDAAFEHDARFQEFFHPVVGVH